QDDRFPIGVEADATRVLQGEPIRVLGGSRLGFGERSQAARTLAWWVRGNHRARLEATRSKERSHHQEASNVLGHSPPQLSVRGPNHGRIRLATCPEQALWAGITPLSGSLRQNPRSATSKGRLPCRSMCGRSSRDQPMSCSRYHVVIGLWRPPAPANEDGDHADCCASWPWMDLIETDTWDSEGLRPLARPNRCSIVRSRPC